MILFDNFFGPKDSDQVCGLQESNSQTCWGTFHWMAPSSVVCLFSSQSALRSRNFFEAVAKRQQEGDYDERVVAGSKSVLVSKSCNEAIFDGISSPGIFGSEDHEMRYETGETQFQSSKRKPYWARPSDELPREAPGYQIESNTEVAHDTGAEPDFWKSYSLHKSVPTIESSDAGRLANEKRLRHYRTIQYNRSDSGELGKKHWFMNSRRIIHGMYAVEHWHEDDSIFNFFKINVSALYVFLTLSKQFQWCKSWESIPLELKWYSIDSVKSCSETDVWISISYHVHLSAASADSGTVRPQT